MRAARKAGNRVAAKATKHEHHGRTDIAGHVEYFDLEEERREQAAHTPRREPTDGHADEGQGHPAPYHHPENVSCMRSHRHTNPDFMKLLADSVGDDAVDADRGESQRQSCEDG